MFKGVTLVEVFVGGVIMIVISVGGVSFLMNCSGLNKDTATKEATEWAKEVGIENANVSCVNSDTDSDGYISCTIAYKDDKGDLKVKAIECASKLSWNSGCRTPKISITQ